MTANTDASVETASTDLPVSDPDALITGRPMPIRDYVFHDPDGKPIKVRMRGLPYSMKSDLDAFYSQEKAENKEKGIVKADLRAPHLLARGMCGLDGKRKYLTHEDQILFAIKLSDQVGDGEVARGYNVLMELSGYGKDAVEEAGKS